MTASVKDFPGRELERIPSIAIIKIRTVQFPKFSKLGEGLVESIIF